MYISHYPNFFKAVDIKTRLLFRCANAFFYSVKWKLLDCFGSRHSHGDGSTHHGVVAPAKEVHHLLMCGDGGAGKLHIGAHPAHGVGHAVGSGASAHIVRVQRTAEAMIARQGLLTAKCCQILL
jgi:hypothetical protein